MGSNARTTSEMQALLQEENEDRAQADASVCSGCSERNYLVSCPEGWSEDSDGSCNPPKAAVLSFSCSRKQYLQKYSTQEKRAFERRCLACYPCAVAVTDSSFQRASPLMRAHQSEEVLKGEFRETGRWIFLSEVGHVDLLNHTCTIA